MVSIKRLMDTLAPSTTVYVYHDEQKRLVKWETALHIAALLEKDNTDGIVEYMTVGAGRINLYLKKPDTK